MGLMETLRSSTKYVVVILIVAFGLIWVLADVDFFGAVTAGPNALGSVNGDKITVEEYQNRIQYYTNLYTQQTGGSMTPEVSAYYSSQAWEELVNARLLEQKMDELGITVSDNELFDMVYGENPDQVIVQNFQRPDGTIDRAYMAQVLTSDEFSQQAISLDIQLRERRRNQKLTNYLTAGLQVLDSDIEREYIKRNSFADVEYIRMPYSEIEESAITVSEADLKTYYNANKENFKQAESYRASYVTFSKLPTAADTTEIIREVEVLRDTFAATGNDSLFLAQQQSVTPYRNLFVPKKDVLEAYKIVLEMEDGTVSSPFLNAGQVSVIKKIAENRNEIKFEVFSRTIEALPGTIRDADEAARDFQLFATDETDFETEAERSGLQVRESFATKGNAFLTGIGNSQQVLNFLEGADEGAISDVFELNTNFVVVKLEDKTEEGYQPLEEVRSIIEVQVKNEKRKSATIAKLSALASANSDLTALAAAAGKEVKSQTGVSANATELIGGGRSPAVIGAIFAMDEGSTSSVISGNSAAFVVKVITKQMADAANMDNSTKEQIRQELEQQLSSRYNAVWIEQLKKGAEIVDNRSRLLIR